MTRGGPTGDALVLAFDGVVADTLALRCDALMAAAHAEQWTLPKPRVRSLLPGRTLQECVLAVAEEEAQGLAADHTLVDLVALRADRMVAERMRQGVMLRDQVSALLHARQATGTKLVLRSDGLRRDVEPALAQLGLELTFTFVRCADDLPRTAGASSLDMSYAAIVRRLDMLRVSTERSALEASESAAGVARTHLGAATIAG